MNSQLDPAITALCATVQHNCAISDARHARDYTLCTYLLRMREYYRWQHCAPLGTTLDIRAVGDWVTKTEAVWDTIEEYEYEYLTLGRNHFNPFDTTAINHTLSGYNLVYSAGLGRMGQAHFMLADLNQRSVENEINHYHCGIEYARDIIAPPAMTLGKNIFIRQDSISRLLWQMYEEWSFKQTPGPMARLAQYYRLTADSNLHRSLTSAAADLQGVFLAHEQGEVAVSELLGEPWQQMSQSMLGTRNEIYLRAVRDLLADSTQTWPMILDNGASHYLDFWLAGIHGVRQQLLDLAGLNHLRNAHSDHTRLVQLENLVQASTRWHDVAQAMLRAYSISGKKTDLEGVALDTAKRAA